MVCALSISRQKEPKVETVSRVKVQPETRLEYMRFDELMAYAQIEGRAIGMEEGSQKNF